MTDTHRRSHCKGSCDHTASDSFFVHAPGEEIAETAKARRTKRKNKESISINVKLSLLILNLEEGDINLLGPRSLKTKLLPVDVDR